MSTLVLAAEGEIRPGEHWTGELGGLTFNLDTILGTVIAGGIVCGLGIYMARGATKGRPNGLQLAFEGLTGWVQAPVKDQMGMRAPRGVVQLCSTLLPGVHLLNEEQIHLAKGVKIWPGAVLDAQGGPIIVGADTEIRANAVITGPTCIGPHCLIRTLAEIREDCSFGPNSRVGGEI